MSVTKKILIVDDSKVSRMVIRAHVEAKFPQWSIVEAGTGEDAIELAELEQPDYCTMDINMPGMLGTQAASVILARHATIRLVLFTANIQEMNQDLAKSMGVPLIAKPVTEKSMASAFQYFADTP